MATIESVFLKHQYSFDTRKKSIKWYENQIKKLQPMSSGSLLKSEKDLLTNRLQIGKMYLYLYDPKFKEKLPYYDTFPLVLPFNRDAEHLIGLNFHYIHPVIRIKMLDKLMTYATNSKMDSTTKIQLSWQTLKGAASYRPLKACVKMYRFDHIQSAFLEIPPDSWVTACMLPVEEFQKKSKNTVYSRSAKIS